MALPYSWIPKEHRPMLLHSIGVHITSNNNNQPAKRTNEQTNKQTHNETTKQGDIQTNKQTNKQKPTTTNNQ